MNLLAALLVVVRYTLHNVKTFILVIYCVVLRISFANCIIVLLGLLMSAFGSSSLRTSSVLIIFCSFCGMNWRFFCTFADRRPYSYPTFVLRQMTMRYSVTPKSYPREPLIAVWSLLYVRSPYTPLTTALIQHFSKKYPKSFVVSKNLCNFAN